MPQIYSFVGLKGGVIKSTDSIYLSQMLANSGETLFVDLDKQRTATAFFERMAGPDNTPLYDFGEVAGDAFTLITDRSDLESSIARNGSLSVLPAHMELVDLDLKAVRNGRAIRHRLAKVLRASDFDYCVIDTPGDIRTEVACAIIASDVVILPLTPDLEALRVARESLALIRDCADEMEEPPVVCVAPSAFKKTQKSKAILEKFQSLPGVHVLDSIIPYSESIVDRMHAGMFLPPSLGGYQAYADMAKEVVSLGR